MGNHVANGQRHLQRKNRRKPVSAKTLERETKFKGCGSKHYFSTMEAAQNNCDTSKRLIEPYKCTFCAGFHVTMRGDLVEEGNR